MRMPNDVRLAESVSEIDIVLGGHDHHYEVKKVMYVYLCSLDTVCCMYSAVYKICDLRK